MRYVLMAVLAITMLGCDKIKNMDYQGDLNACRKFADRETRTESEKIKIITDCMHQQGHYGYTPE